MATVQYGSKLRHQSGGRLLEILCGIKGGFEVELRHLLIADM
jgi:hypothetical protein